MTHLQSASKLPDQEILLDAMMDGGKHGVIVTDQNKRITFFNRAAERIYGYDAVHFVGSHIETFINEAFMPSEMEAEAQRLSNEFTKPVCIDTMFREAVRQFGTYEKKWTVVRRSGEKVPVMVALTALRNKEGEIYGLLNISQYLSELQALEHQIREHSMLLHAIMGGGEHGIVVVGRNGIITSFNQAAERILGHKAARFLEKSVGEMVREIHVPSELEEEAKRLSLEFKRPVSVEEIFYLPFEKRNTHENQWTVFRGDGASIPISLTLTALRNEEGKLCGNLAIFQDISERRKMERIKNEFISTVSHELRTPLTSIRAVLGLLVNGDIASEKRTELLSVAQRNSERLALLVNDILHLDKIDSANLSLHIVPVSVTEIIQHAIEMNNAYGEKYRISFVRKRISAGTRVMADPDRLMQVLANLLSNAAKFSPAGSEVWLSAECENNRVRFMVRDFGPGIAKNFQEKIFEKFAQADASDTREGSGTGLGLNIAKKLVEAMGGSLGFETKEGSGSTFFFDLMKSVLPVHSHI